jgi:hypothetical protein
MTKNKLVSFGCSPGSRRLVAVGWYFDGKERPTLLISIQRLLPDIIPGENHDDREIFVDESQDTMLQLTRHDSLAMKVGNFLDFEGT